MCLPGSVELWVKRVYDRVESGGNQTDIVDCLFVQLILGLTNHCTVCSAVDGKEPSLVVYSRPKYEDMLSTKASL